MLATTVLRSASLRILDCRCTAGPGDEPFVEQHESFSVSYVRRGSFGYRTRGRSFELVAGSVLVGHLGDEFLCTHDHHVCGDECLSGGGDGGTGGGSASIPPGLYLEFSRILDAKEPWFRGDPEIEVHIQGPYMGSAPTYADDLSCASEHPYDVRKYFDQNTAFWQGRVLLFSQEEIAGFFQRFGAGFHIMFWEDDNQPCTLKLDSNPLADFVRSAAQAFGSVAFKFLPNAPWKLVAVTFVAIMFSNPGSWLMTNDDFLGMAIPQYEWTESYPDNTHVIVDVGNVLNGRANIVIRP